MLLRLEDFAEFEVMHGGVKIKQVYCGTYGFDAYPRVKELLPEYWSLSGLDTSKRVSNQIFDRLMFEDMRILQVQFISMYLGLVKNCLVMLELANPGLWAVVTMS